MNNNIFFNGNKKFNPDIDSKLIKKKNERNIEYTFQNKVDKPIITGEVEKDLPINIKQKIFEKKKERDLLDAEISKKKYKHKNFASRFDYTPYDNIERNKSQSKNHNSKKSDKLIADLKKLGILN